MRFDAFFRTWEGTRSLNRILGVAVGAQSLALVGLGVLLLRQDRIVTMVPPDFQQEMSVRRGTADPVFFESWASFFATSLGNVSPSNVDFVRRSVEGFLCVEIYNDVVVAIERETQRLRQDRVVTRFEPKRVMYEPATGLAFVHGHQVLDSVTGSQTRADRTFEFLIQVVSHKPQLCRVSSYPGPPRTLDVRQGERDRASEHRREPGREKGS